MPKSKKKKESKKPFIIGFGVTVGVLIALSVGLLYYQPPVQVNSLPKSIPQYGPMWAKYVPDSVIQFGFENYSAIRRYNSSYPIQYKVLLNIVDLKSILPAVQIRSVLSVTFSKPNESIAFAFVNQQAWTNFTNGANNVSYAAVKVGNDSMFYVRNSEQGTFQYGWLALIPADHAVAFALGNTEAKAAMLLCLQTTPTGTLLSKLNVREMLYIVNGTGHLAVGLQGFAGVLPAANNTVTVVDDSGGQVVIKRVLEFTDTNSAVGNYNFVRQAYLSARVFSVFSPGYVKATEYEAQADLVGAVRLVE